MKDDADWTWLGTLVGLLIAGITAGALVAACLGL